MQGHETHASALDSGELLQYWEISGVRRCGADHTADGVDDASDEPRRGAARVPFWAGAQVNLDKLPPQLPQDDLHVAMVGLEVLSTSGVLEFISRPLIPRRECRLYVGSLLYGVRLKS